MKYCALLRGINVGGKKTVRMADLKKVFEKAGLTKVITYINSGNVLFESNKNNSHRLENEIEKLLEKTFFPVKTVVVSQKELQEVVNNVPHMWKEENMRKYVAFVKFPAQPEEVLKEIRPKNNVDFVNPGPGVVYMTTKTSGLTKSSFPKFIATKIYRSVTMRNYNTVQKLRELMEK